MREIEVATFDQYCLRCGVASFAPIDAGMHSGRAHISRRANRTAARLLNVNLAQLEKQRAALRLEYDQRCREGSVRPPSRIEHLTLTAQGTDEAAAAARRILALIARPP